MLVASTLEMALAEIETLLDKVGEALQSAQAEQLQLASVQLRNAALRFSQCLESDPAGASGPEFAARVRTVGVRLAGQRDGLARVTALVERQVATVLPEQAPASTYGSGAAGHGAAIARIYRSAG